MSTERYSGSCDACGRTSSLIEVASRLICWRCQQEDAAPDLEESGSEEAGRVCRDLRRAAKIITDPNAVAWRALEARDLDVIEVALGDLRAAMASGPDTVVELHERGIWRNHRPARDVRPEQPTASAHAESSKAGS
jgi:hypothetical protein